jgi:hypothetical protein
LLYWKLGWNKLGANQIYLATLTEIEWRGQEPMSFHSECAERGRRDWLEFELTQGHVLDVLLYDVQISADWNKGRLFHLEVVGKALKFTGDQFEWLNELGAH